MRKLDTHVSSVVISVGHFFIYCNNCTLYFNWSMFIL